MLGTGVARGKGLRSDVTAHIVRHDSSMATNSWPSGRMAPENGFLGPVAGRWPTHHATKPPLS